MPYEYLKDEKSLERKKKSEARADLEKVTNRPGFIDPITQQFNIAKAKSRLKAVSGGGNAPDLDATWPFTPEEKYNYQFVLTKARNLLHRLDRQGLDYDREDLQYNAKAYANERDLNSVGGGDYGPVVSNTNDVRILLGLLKAMRDRKKQYPDWPIHPEALTDQKTVTTDRI